MEKVVVVFSEHCIGNHRSHVCARVSQSRPGGELARLAARRREDVRNRRKFTSDILSIIEQKKLQSKSNDTDEAISVSQNIVDVEDQDDPYYPHKVTFQEKSPKHEALKKLFDIADMDEDDEVQVDKQKVI